MSARILGVRWLGRNISGGDLRLQLDRRFVEQCLEGHFFEIEIEIENRFRNSE